MNKTLLKLAFADAVFVLFLALKGLFSEPLSLPFYAAAYIIPVLMLLPALKKRDSEIMAVDVKPTRSSVGLSALFCAPVVFGVIIISFLMSLLGMLLGANGQSIDTSGNILYVLFIHAVAPAVFEEMLFRYIPIRLMAGESPKLAVVYSSIFFALAHCNLLQIPYALFAGAVFAALTVASGNIVPAVIIHFFNNLLSVMLSRCGESYAFIIVFLTLVVLAFFASLLIIYLRREKYKKLFSAVFDDKSKLKFTKPLVFYAITTLVIAVTAMFL